MKWLENEKEELTKVYSESTKKELLTKFPNRTYTAIKLMGRKLNQYKELNERIGGDLNVLLNDTFETYYWIGFIMADGTINHDRNILKVGLSIEDGVHLKKLAIYLKMGEPHTYSEIIELKIMDNNVIPLIINKFNFKPRKTYNPPSLEYLDINEDLFYAFLIGFIDGDGSIIKTRDKNEYRISIRLHKNWYVNLKYFHEKLSDIFNIEMKGLYNYDAAMLVISEFKILKLLKNKTIELGLPVLDRKWCKIDINRITKREQSIINKEKVKYLFNQNKSILQIAKEVGLSYSRVYAICNY